MTTPAGLPAAKTPYLLRTPGLLLRCMEPADAARRKEAVDSSGAFLEAFFPPTPEGRMSQEVHIAHLRKLRAGFDLDQDRIYGVFDSEGGRQLGEAGLFKRVGADALEITYWLRQDATGLGIGTKMASAIVKTAFELDRVKRLDLFCAWDNERSAALARRLGFTFEGRLRDRQFAAYHPRGDVLSFTLLDSEYPRTPARELPLEAFDSLGRKIT